MKVILETYALMATIPFITYFFIYYLLLFMKKSKKVSFQWAMNITTILLISAVSAQLKLIFKFQSEYLFSFTWILFIMLSIGYLQWKKKGRIHKRKILSATSLIGFVSFSLFYLLLFIIGLLKVSI